MGQASVLTPHPDEDLNMSSAPEGCSCPFSMKTNPQSYRPSDPIIIDPFPKFQINGVT